MRVKLFAVIVLSVLIGCSSLEIKESATHQAIAYGSGKGVAIGVNSFYPAVDIEFTSAWVGLMIRNRDNEMVDSTEMLMFYNNCLGIIAVQVNDEYGLLGDLGAMLTIFGAQFAPDGQMTSIKPVPYSVMQFFEMGYTNGRAIGKRIYTEKNE